MTQTLSRDPSDPLFQPVTDRDPATPGDPLRRVRYHYGQCLSAEDFETEQRYFVLRQRLHNALLHGVGTVWGLAIHRPDPPERKEPPEGDGGVRLFCDPGLAIDPLGREIWVPQQLCLDLTALEEVFWLQLNFTNTQNPNRRRAYVVLRYEACLSDAVPAIPVVCGDDTDGQAFSRLRDSYRLCLEAEPPPDPYSTVRDITRRPLPTEPRRRLLDHALNAPPLGPLAPLERFWSGADDAALLLATLDLEATPADAGEGRQSVKLVTAAPGISNPDNSVRAVLPSVQALADLALGIRLEGPSSVPVPFQALGVSAQAVDSNGAPVTSGVSPDATLIEIRLSEQALVDSNPGNTLENALQLFLLGPANKWTEVTSPGIANWSVSSPSEPPALRLRIKPALTASTTFQVLLKGSGLYALLSKTTPPQPLSGVAGEVVPAGSGRDAHLFATYIPPTP